MKVPRRSTLTLLLAFLLLSSPVLHESHVIGQVRSEEDSSNDDQSTNENPNAYRGIIGNQAGVSISAAEVFRSFSSKSTTNDLDAVRRASAKPKVSRRSCSRQPAARLRYVSLPRLELAVTKRLAAGEQVTSEMRFLAGLFRADYLYIYPETGDVVIAGPADAWQRTKSGSVLTVNSKQPVLRLEDLVVALRAFANGEKGPGEVGCSIDPTPQGLARMQAYVRYISQRPPSAPVIAAGLKKALGEQTVSVIGVPPTTRFARVMIEADYRMKLIGIGLETPAVPIKSYLSLARPRSSPNGMARWYFTPRYDCIRTSPDRRVLQLSSSGARLVGAAELVSSAGIRSQLSTQDRASQGFARDFTRKYAALAKAEPIYAELRNVMDLSIIGAALQFFEVYAACDWQPELLLNASKLDVESHAVPTKLPTAVNAVWKGRRLLTPVGGGVSIRSAEAFESLRVMHDPVELVRPVVPVDLVDDKWWWDDE